MIEDTYNVPAGTPVVHPDRVVDASGALLYEGDKPLAWAIENLDGAVVESGRYKVGKIARSKGGLFVSRFKHSATMAGFVEGDTVSMLDGTQIEPLVFRGFYVECSSRSAWMTLDATGPYRVSWEWCKVDGGYNHDTRSGFDSKWGFVPHRWDGHLYRCEFTRIKREHGVYAHTFEGSELIVLECKFSRTGRTGFQHVGREAEGGYSQAVAKFTRCTFEDAGLKDGGSALTAQGIKAVIVKDCRSFIGRDPAFVDRYLKANPDRKVFGTGHFVNWPEWVKLPVEEAKKYMEEYPATAAPIPDGAEIVSVIRNLPSELVALHDFRAWSAPGCGEANMVQVKSAKRLQVSGALNLYYGKSKPWEFYGSPIQDWSGIDPTRLFIGAST